jgi:hypothetical protein
VRWDTRQWENGEHLVEVRALDGAGKVLTRSKALVVTENSLPPSNPPPTTGTGSPPAQPGTGR